MTRTLITLIAALASTALFAHAELEKTMPVDGASLSSAPDELVLEFSEAVTLTALTVLAADGTEHAVEGLPRKPAARIAVAAPELAPGRYRVDWRALSDDSHIESGEFAFEIGAGGLR